jgi:RNA polymerase sigma factor (sigma-70 family)
MKLNEKLNEAIKTDSLQKKKEFHSELYEVFHFRIISMAYYYFPDNQILLEDIVHDIFLKLFSKRLEFFEPKMEFLDAYVLKMAKNHCINVWKARKNKHVSLNENAVVGLSDIFVYEGDSDNYYNIDLIESIKHLPQKLRIVITYVLNGYKYSEISEILEISESAIKKRVQRAKQKIKDFHKEFNE